MRYGVRSLIMAILFFLAGGRAVYAHERWFTEQGGQHIGENHWLDWMNAAIILGGLILITLVVLIDRSAWYARLQQPLEQLRQKLPKGIEWRFVALLAAVALIANVITGVFLAQDLLLPGLSVTTNPFAQLSRAFLSGDSVLHWGPATLGGIAQLLLAMVLLSQTTFLIPGVLILLVALPLAVLNFTPDLLVDYVVEFMALAFALIFFGMQASSIDRRIATWLSLDPSRYAGLPVPIIRIGVGLTLVVLALHDKLLSPNMALSFLDQHYFNFMEQLGFTAFSDIRFVFAAGIVELSVGLLLVFGIATRFCAAVVFLLMSVTIAILGARELVGHIPIMGIAILLIYRGSGGYRLAATAVRARKTELTDELEGQTLSSLRKSQASN